MTLGTPHSVRLLWTTDQHETELVNRKHTTLTRDGYQCPRGIRIRNPNKQVDKFPRLTPLVHKVWQSQVIVKYNE
jgi:hypothetical protein